jgi:hypothetical protein
MDKIYYVSYTNTRGQRLITEKRTGEIRRPQGQPQAAAPQAAAPQPQGPAPEGPRLPQREYEQNQEIDALLNGEWRPGQIGGIENYTVLNTATGINITIAPENIRGQYRLGTRQRCNLRVYSPIEFRQGNRWFPGTINAINYLVNMVDNRGGLETVSQSNLRPRAGPQPPQPPNQERAEWRANVARWREELARPAPRAAAVRPTGVAWEIHNAFDDLELPKFMAVVRRENNGASNFKNTENILRPLFQYISSSDTTLSPEQKTRYKTNFRKPKGIIENVQQFISDHPEAMTDTLEVIQFVLSQEPKYKDLYIETFDNECMGAYNITGTGQSCTKGMWERIYLANKGTIEGLCFDELQGNASTSAAATSASSSSSSCKPVYLELYNAFTPGADIDINDIFYKWYNKFSYDAIPEEENPLKNLSIDARKQHYRDFVRQDDAISQKIWNNKDFQKKIENSIKRNEKIFETLDAAAIGGRLKRNNNKKTIKRRKNKTIKKRKNKTIKKRR